jgi:copper chaperone
MYPQSTKKRIYMKLQVENIKCGGCAQSIKTGLLKVEGVSDVQVDIHDGAVEVSGDNLNEEVIVKKLHSMGYPLPGQGGTLTTATSYVSCMIGRILD